jgi:hypothetical protein
MMIVPPADLGFIEQTYRSAADAVVEAYTDSNNPPELGDTTPELLVKAADGLLDILHKLEPNHNFGEQPVDAPVFLANDLQNLGDYGIQLMTDLALWAQALNLSESLSELRMATFALTWWIVQHGGELSRLESVVDTLAFVANSIKAPHELERLFAAASEIMESVSPAISQDLDQSNPGRPWRILVLNRAIIATRSHNPALMELAFQSLGELLPEDAPSFFREGMEQMNALNYPDHVRKVMEKHYQLWCTPKTLH